MRFGRIADGLAIAVAVSLPWSSSAASILILLMLLALVPAQTPRDVLQEVATPAGGVPVALFVLAALGMTWADVSWAEGSAAWIAFAKLADDSDSPHSLFDFTQGWIYVFGVGVAGGTVLRKRCAEGGACGSMPRAQI